MLLSYSTTSLDRPITPQLNICAALATYHSEDNTWLQYRIYQLK